MRAQHGAEEHVHLSCQLRAALRPRTPEDGLLSVGLATTVTLLFPPPGGGGLSLMTSFCLCGRHCGDQSVV